MFTQLNNRIGNIAARLHWRWIHRRLSAVSGIRPRPQRRSRRLHGLEALEARQALDGSGVLTGNAAYLTLSFAPDGTDVAGRASGLFSRLNTLAPEADWQGAVLRAFQTWAVETNADLGVVSDGGQPFGSPAAQRHDPRFGDVRIGAIPLPLDVLAVSVPSDSLVAGSWVGDVLFNSNATFANLSDVFSIALHEAGHVFGLPHNDDPLSPMHVHGISAATEPAPSDLAVLRQVFGARAADANETDHADPSIVDNDTLAHATRLKLTKTPGHEEGTGPSIVYGDVTTPDDADYFFLEEISNYAGSVSFSVRSDGISLLAPTIEVYNEAGSLLAESSSTSAAGDWLTLQIDRLPDDGGYYVKVGGVAGDVAGRGGYSLTATWDGMLLADPARIDEIAGGGYRHLRQEELQQFFEKSQPDFLNDDQHHDDDAESGMELESATGYQTRTRYESLGSISDATDRDFYKVKSPASLAPFSALRVLVHSLDAGKLVPRVHVYDDEGALVASQVLVNGGGDLVIQVIGIQPDMEYVVAVESADLYGVFRDGNYEMTVTFGAAQETPASFASGELSPATPQVGRTLYVGETQLFHVLLAADAIAATTPTSAWAVLYDSAGNVVHRLAAPAGETRSGGSVILEPGAYTIGVAAVTLDGSPPPTFGFELSGIAVSEPIGPEPQDPGGTPLYECPDNPGTFCYPGGVTTTDPFFWSGPPPTLPTLPPLDTTQLSSLLLADWWSYLWTTGTTTAPTAMPDQYTTTSGTVLATTATTGVLANDTRPQGDPLTALLQTQPAHGTLSLAFDGSFTYQPHDGFQGADQFSYVATDFRGLSNVVVVSLVTTTSSGLTGDLDGDGRVSLHDVALLQQQLGATGAPGTMSADLNGDGVINRADVAWMAMNYGTTTTPAPSPAMAVVVSASRQAQRPTTDAVSAKSTITRASRSHDQNTRSQLSRTTGETLLSARRLRATQPEHDVRARRGNPFASAVDRAMTEGSVD